MRVVLIGGGGHASDVLSAIEAAWDPDANPVIGIVDDKPLAPGRFETRGIERIGALDDLPRLGATHFVLAVGMPKTRRLLCARIGDLKPLTVIHPAARIASGATVGEGAVVLAGAILSAMSRIGSHALIHHNAVIGHDCEVGAFASIMPGAAVSGDVIIGPDTLIGANAVVIQGLRIGAGATVGAGGVATRDIPDGVVATGIPANWTPRL